MAYTLPTFNLLVHVWRFGNPTSNPPDDTVLANLTPGRRTRGIDGMNEPLVAAIPGMFLLFPQGFDLRGDVNTGGSPDTVEVDASSGWFYTVHYVDRVGLGFANAHMFAELLLLSVGPGGGGGGGSSDFVLLETGDFVLLETGDFVLLE